ncbi:MAG: DNA-3-methyladenine glycosylase [Ignavibacteriales bacterium]|nr:DNA-3-methyladenine glycosylase [Ignavibacteriales bacterium]
MKKVPRSFYLRPTIQVARELLGKFLVRRLRGKLLIGKIVEVEAYRGVLDPASHAYRGKTKRNEVMFWEGGHLYVYFTYGMHFCANVVTRNEGIGEAVLLRAVEPVKGIGTMQRNRRKSRLETKKLTSGPAKFCQAFGITQKENGTDLMGNTIFIANGEKIARSQIGSSTRIGINVAMEKKWRFFVKGNVWVSR